MSDTDLTPTTIFHMYAHRNSTTPNDKFIHVYPSQRQVEMCGNDEIVEVSVKIVEEGEEQTHWGWLDTGKERPTMIWPSYHQLCVCFQGELGMMDRVNRGFGKSVRLIVKELNRGQ